MGHGDERVHVNGEPLVWSLNKKSATTPHALGCELPLTFPGAKVLDD